MIIFKPGSTLHKLFIVIKNRKFTIITTDVQNDYGPGFEVVTRSEIGLQLLLLLLLLLLFDNIIR